MRWRAEVATRLCARLVLPPGGRVGICAPTARDRAALQARLPDALSLSLHRVAEEPACIAGASLDAAIAWLVMARIRSADRLRLLEGLRQALRVGGTLLVVDHNRPRTWWRRVENAGWCLMRGIDPLGRPAYPVAREVQAASFADISLHFALGERLQVVHAVRPPVEEIAPSRLDITGGVRYTNR